MTRLGLVALVLLTSCTGTGDDPIVTASPHQELRWVDVPEEGGGFGVPADWVTTTGGAHHSAAVAAATRPEIVEEVVQADNDSIDIRYVRLDTLRSDDAFVELTVGILLSGRQPKHYLPRQIAIADFSDAVDKHLGVPVREVTGWRSGDRNVRVRYWIGPDASAVTRSELAMILERIELP